MRGFLRNLGQEDEDRNTDGRKCHNSKEKEEEGLLATSVTANSCGLDGLRRYELMTDLHQKQTESRSTEVEQMKQ